MRFSDKLDPYSDGIFTRLARRKRELASRRGADVIDLSVGTPDLPPAPHVMEALSRAALEPNAYRYALGDLPELKAAAARWYARRFGVTLDPERQVCSLLGSQDGLAHLALAALDPGDTVLVPDPGYPIFSMGPYLAGARIVTMPQKPENGYVININAIDPEDARRAKLMVVSYPNNPTCVCAPEGFHARLARFALDNDILVLYDNAYCELTGDGPRAGSFLAAPGALECGVEFNSLSKSYAMPGCRVGFALGCAEAVRRIETLKSHIDYGMFLPIQRAAIAALDGPQDCVARARAAYASRARRFAQGLREGGWNVDTPQGTMFLWARIPAGFDSAEAFCEAVMEKTGVVLVPGDSFGSLGRLHVRAALVQSEERLAEAARRIAESGLTRREDEHEV